MGAELQIDSIGAGDQRWADMGITYRQLDWWTRRGWLLTADGVTSGPGSGYQRRWPVSEVEVAERMIRLVCVGFTPSRAAMLSRLGVDPIDLGHGVTVTVSA